MLLFFGILLRDPHNAGVSFGSLLKPKGVPSKMDTPVPPGNLTKPSTSDSHKVKMTAETIEKWIGQRPKPRTILEPARVSDCCAAAKIHQLAISLCREIRIFRFAEEAPCSRSSCVPPAINTLDGNPGLISRDPYTIHLNIAL